MKETIFVIGGCRSGKSRYALELGERVSGGKKIFAATCIPHDKEMKNRVKRHQEGRSKIWSTMEVPVKISEAISEQSEKADVILVDCLTLWISNLLLETEEIERIEGRIAQLTESLKNSKCTVILVSNEVGTGIVPENRIARLFRDAAGFVNSNVAACSDKVFWMVAGIPVLVKPALGVERLQKNQ